MDHKGRGIILLAGLSDQATVAQREALSGRCPFAVSAMAKEPLEIGEGASIASKVRPQIETLITQNNYDSTNLES